MTQTTSISRKVLLPIIFAIFTLCVVFAMTNATLGYYRSLKEIDRQLSQIKNSHLPTLISSMWLTNDDLVHQEMEGIVRFPAIASVHIIDESGIGKCLNCNRTEEFATEVFPLVYSFRNKSIELGTLKLGLSKEYRRELIISYTALDIIEMLFTAIILSGLIALLFNHLIGNRLKALTNYIASIDHMAISPEKDAVPAVIHSQPDNRKDEIDQLLRSFTELQDRLKLGFDQLESANKSLRTEVAERTEAEHKLLLYKMALEATDELVVVMDRDYRYMLVNDATARTYRKHRSEIEGHYAWDMLGKDIFEETRHYIDQCFRGQPTSYEALRSFHNTKVHVAVSYYPIFTEGTVSFIVGVLNDVTAERVHQEEILAAKNEAEAANRAKSVFLANMSHEIRTPLNGIIGMLQLLKSTPLDKEQKEYSETAFESSLRLTNLLSDILDLSRIEAGAINMTHEPFRIKDVLESVEKLFGPSAAQSDLHFSVSCDPELPDCLTGDSSRIQQIINNLVGNAIKFTEQGFVRLGVSILPQTTQETVNILLIVEDSGIGIPDDRLPELFHPFTQLEGSYTRQYQGAGLGLSIVKRLVDLMDGDITVSSTEGQGSTFYVTLKLPVAQCPQRKADRDNASQLAIPALNILVAEDERINRRAAVRLLEKAGCTVTAVENGKQVLKTLQDNDFDLVLMDIQMPVMNGIDAAVAIRNGEAGDDRKDIPIVALTAYAMPVDKEAFLDAGMDGYLAKPVKLEDLARVLEESLKMKKG